MKRLFQATRGFAAGLALAGAASQVADAQFVSVNNYQPQPTQQAYQPAAPGYGAQSYGAPSYGTQPAPTSATYGYGAQPYPGQAYPVPAPPTQAAAPPVNPAVVPAPQPAAAPQYTAAEPQYGAAMPAQQLAPPTYGSYTQPRLAQAGELPTPAEAVQNAAAAATQVTPEPATAAYPQAAPQGGAAMPYQNAYQNAPAPGYPAPATVASSSCATGDCVGGLYGPTTYAAPASYGGCATGACGVDYGAASSCGVGYGACDYGAAPACDVGCAPVRKRQWFAGLYGLYLARGGDSSKAAVSYMTDTSTFAGGGDDYYPMPSDAWLFTSDAETDDFLGAEVRFGSTFGCDPCSCNQPFAWELGYWALDDEYAQATLLYPGMVGPANDNRIYSMGPSNYRGLYMDRDGAGGGTYPNRPIYVDPGDPADDVLTSNDVRIVGVRVRSRFSAQNLELNFWRFGTPACAPSCGVGGGALAGGACNLGGACGTGNACGYGACAPCRPPRRFVINGVMGVRYLRVDDDFGLDMQYTTTDGTGAVIAGDPTGYTGFPFDDNVIFSDFQADNELVGFQLGCSMNWTVGCRWNVFADSNFGIYGNSADVHKCVYAGGTSGVTFSPGNGGAIAEVHGSETSLAYVGELRAGVGYQISCNCRLTAAYRFIGIGGVALGAEEFQNTNWANAELASHIDTNNSIILHGVQTGVEYKY